MLAVWATAIFVAAMSDPAKETPGQPRPPRLGATDYAIDALTAAIRAGRFAPGERLTEAQLTRDLDVSRGSLREALRRVAADGLIDLEPHRGAVVRRLGRRELSDLLVVREVLEGLAASLAAGRSGTGEAGERIAALRIKARALRSGRPASDLLDNNVEFHRAIAELGANPALVRLIEQLQLPAFRRRFFDQVQNADWERSLREHEAVLDAISDGDAQLAEQLMRAHIRRTRRIFEALPEDAFDRGDAER